MNIRFLLFYRWLCVNVFGAALLGAAHFNGWTDLVLAADSTNIVLLIMMVFVWGTILTGQKIWKISRELNFLKNGETKKSVYCDEYHKLKRKHPKADAGSLVESLKLKMFTKIAFVRYMANSLVILGLIGTVLGFIIALSGVDPSIVTNVGAIAPMLSTLISGMSIALYTTLVGAIFNLWLMINYHVLAAGMVKLVTEILETTGSGK